MNEDQETPCDQTEDEPEPRPSEIPEFGCGDIGSKYKRNKMLTGEEQEMILNIHKYFAHLSGEKGALKKTSEITQVPYRTVRRIIGRGEPIQRRTHKRESFTRLDSSHKRLISHTLKKFQSKNEVPSMKALFKKLKEKDSNLPYSESTLRRFLQEYNAECKNKTDIVTEHS